MDGFKHYVSKKYVDAMQWFPGVQCERVTLFRDFSKLDPAKPYWLDGTTVSLHDCGKCGGYIVKPGDWLVLHSNGGIDVVGDEEFKRKYKAD